MQAAEAARGDSEDPAGLAGVPETLTTPRFP